MTAPPYPCCVECWQLCGRQHTSECSRAKHKIVLTQDCAPQDVKAWMEYIESVGNESRVLEQTCRAMPVDVWNARYFSRGRAIVIRRSPQRTWRRLFEAALTGSAYSVSISPEDIIDTALHIADLALKAIKERGA